MKPITTDKSTVNYIQKIKHCLGLYVKQIYLYKQLVTERVLSN